MLDVHECQLHSIAMLLFSFKAYWWSVFLKPIVQLEFSKTEHLIKLKTWNWGLTSKGARKFQVSNSANKHKYTKKNCICCLSCTVSLLFEAYSSFFDVRKMWIFSLFWAFGLYTRRHVCHTCFLVLLHVSMKWARAAAWPMKSVQLQIKVSAVGCGRENDRCNVK